MISIESQYFNLSKVLLQAIGLWPYQQTKVVRIQVIVLSMILAVLIVVQITPIITSECTAEFIITCLSTTIVFFISLIKYISFHVHIKTIKHLFIQLQYISNKLKDETEITIIEKYGWNARYYTSLLLLVLTCTISILLLEQFWPTILAIALYQNISRPHILQIKTEYFLDQEKYFYFILFHINIACFIALLIVIAIGTMFIAYFQYISGIFTIVSYRIEHAIETDMLSPITSKNENIILLRTTRAIEMHQQAMNLCTLLVNTVETTFFWLIIFGVISLSLNLFRIFQTISSADIKDLIFPILLAIICTLYMFVANYVGQDITDHNNLIYTSIYNVQWYRAPLPIQKVILILLERGTKKFTLSIGGLFDASFECFATLVKASVSYFTFIYSTR